MATDNFNRADGGLGADWSVIQGSISIVSNQAKSGLAGDSAAMWQGAGGPFSDVNQYAQVLSVAAVNFWGPAVLMSSGPNYYAYYNNGTVQKCVAGTRTNLLTTTSFTAGDTARLVREGTWLVAVKNGTVVGAVQDASLSTGEPGFIFTNSTSAVLDDWEGGEPTGTTFARMSRLSENISQTSDAAAALQMTRLSEDISHTSDANSNLLMTRLSVNISVTPDPPPPDGGGQVPPGSAPPGGLIPLRPKLFVKIKTPANNTYYHAFTEMNDNPAWPEGGYKPAKLVYISDFTTKLSNIPQQVSFNFTIFDREAGNIHVRDWREIAATETIEGSQVTIFAIDDDIRLAGGQPYALISGEVVKHTTGDGLNYEFHCQDITSRRLTGNQKDTKVPAYAFSTAFDKSAVGKYPPVALGKFISSRGLLPGRWVGTVNPFTQWGGTATNALFDIYIHTMFARAQFEGLYYTMPTWSSEQPVTAGWFNRPTPDKATGLYYKVTTAGTTGTTEPTWPTVIGNTVGDGTVTWTAFAADDPSIRFKVEDTAYGTTTLVTSGVPAFLTVTGGTTEYIDFEGQRFGQVTLVRRDFIYAKPLREGHILIGADIYGVTEFADGTGRYFDTPEQCLVFLGVHQVWNRSTGITYAAMPTINGYGVFDMDSLAASEAVHADRLGGDPYIATVLVGRGEQQQSGFSIWQEIAEGGDFKTGTDRHGRIRFVSEDPEAAIELDYDDLLDLKYCIVETDTDNNKNYMQFFGGFRYMPDDGQLYTPAPGQPLPRGNFAAYSKWSYYGVANDTTAQTKVGSVKELIFENYASHDKDTIDNVASSRFSRYMGPLSPLLTQMYDGRKIAKMAGGWSLLGRGSTEAKLGTMIGLTSVQGLTSLGYVRIKAMIEEITISPMRGEIIFKAPIMHVYSYTLTSDVLIAS